MQKYLWSQIPGDTVNSTRSTFVVRFLCYSIISLYNQKYFHIYSDFLVFEKLVLNANSIFFHHPPNLFISLLVFFISFQQRQMSYDPTEYVQRARVSKAAPPKPAANPLQFVQMKPCNLYQSAQEHLKRVEEVKKVKEVIKEEPEDWQSVSYLFLSFEKKRNSHCTHAFFLSLSL